MRPQHFLFFCLLSLAYFSCKKDLRFTGDSSAKLSFSRDTVLFDTVFTTVGSATKQFKVYNRNKDAVKISNIILAGGKTSQFRINVDGIAGPSHKDYELAGNDSMFVFVEVTVDPNSSATPYIVTDSIVFQTNGNTQQIQLAAYGQNAHFYRDSILPCNTTWPNDLPHVVYGGVLVDSLCTLNIQKGAKVYFHKSAALYVRGTLRVNGTREDSVTFQGDRLEEIYYDEPGQWIGIWFLKGSVDNRINYAVIKNALIGVRVDSLPVDGSMSPNLTIQNTIIKHMNLYGILGFTARIHGYNNLVFNCGRQAVLGSLGGDYIFRHCTFANSPSTFNRQEPSVVMVDYYKVPGYPAQYASLKVDLVNNIIWGNQEDEFLVEFEKSSPALIFDYNLVRTKRKDLPPANILNKDPLFVNPHFGRGRENYRVDSLSPAYQKGFYLNTPTVLLKDLDGNTRPDPPTIGCYEYIRN